MTTRVGEPRGRAQDAAFGVALKSAMKRRHYTCQRLSDEAGVNLASIIWWRKGKGIPVPENLAVVADLLDAPNLVELSRAILTVACRECGRDFVLPIHSGRMFFCEGRCRARWNARERRERTRTDRPKTFAVLKGKVNGLTVLLLNMTEDRDGAQAAIDAMCRDCEWDGLCKTPTCKLRSRSPLPLAKAHVA